MNNEQIKKMGTPVVEAGLGGGEVLGAVPVKTLLVKYRDGHGKEAVRLVAYIPGGEIYFFGKDALDLRPAQGWLKTAVNKLIKE